MVINESDKNANPRKITILGSTGSIGCNTLELIQSNPDAYQIEALTANTNFELLAAQAKESRASLAVVADEKKYKALKNALNGSSTEAAAGLSLIHI